MGGPRVFMIGLDGGSWDIIRPLIDRGCLPNIQGLIDDSCWGVLKSTFPACTCPAWFTFSTGMKPSHIGIYHFHGMPKGSNCLQRYDYGDLEQAEFWDVLMQQGISCGIINHPLLYHRKNHIGYIIPGGLIPEQECRSFPAGLMHEIDKAVGGYEIDQQGVFFIDDQTLLSGCLEVARKRTKAMSYLITEHPTDFFLGIYTIPDRISHRFLARASMHKGAEGEAAWRALEESYGEVDRGIGHLMSLMKEDDFLFMISDHGFKAKPWSIHINQFLIDQGLLSVGTRSTLEKAGLTRRNLGRFLNKMGFKTQWMEGLYRFAPGVMRDLLPAGKTIYGEYLLPELIEQGRLDWSRTRAVFLGSGIYINTTDRPEGMVPPGEVKNLKRRIKEELEKLHSPDGEPSPIRALEPEEIYGRGETINPPDIMVTGADVWELEISISADHTLFSPNDRAGHSQDGIFMLRHPRARPGELAQPLEMEDVAPLVLHVCHQPVPGGMDGRVRRDLFRQDTD
jgi:predicted AlkP superfamily phosphohydrolase/phosphomutase